jgi:hypothetical protein
MEQSASKIVGKLVMMIGLGMCIYAGVAGEGWYGAIGGLVVLGGRIIDEYFDDWF